MKMATRAIVVSTLFCLTTGFLGSEGAPFPPTMTVQTSPTSADGQALIGQVCIQCHSLDPIFSQRKSAQDWTETVSLMNWRGAQLFPGEAEAIAGYLADNFGLDSSVAASHDASENDADGAEGTAGGKLVAERCVMCHSLDIVMIQKKTSTEWDETINRMVGYGLSLSEDEMQSITDYLADAYGLD